MTFASDYEPGAFPPFAAASHHTVDAGRFPLASFRSTKTCGTPPCANYARSTRPCGG